jgi:hypothetical protein
MVQFLDRKRGGDCKKFPYIPYQRLTLMYLDCTFSRFHREILFEIALNSLLGYSLQLSERFFLYGKLNLLVRSKL